MKIHVLFFAKLREQVGLHDLELELAVPADDVCLQDIIDLLLNNASEHGFKAGQFKALGESQVLAALNHEMLDADSDAHQVALNDGDELAFFPPVTGG